MILELHRQGGSVSAIARQVGLDRKTVDKYIERGLEPAAVCPRPPRVSKVARFSHYLRERFAAFPQLTARRLHRELRDLGYTGGYSILTDFLRDIRPIEPAPSGLPHKKHTRADSHLRVPISRSSLSSYITPGIRLRGPGGSVRVAAFIQGGAVPRGEPVRSTWKAIFALAIAFAAGTLGSCASLMPQPFTGRLDYKERAVTQTEGELRVSTAVLSADESTAVYGIQLAKRVIQPVWIEVENREKQVYYLLSPGLDPNFFPASEAAEALSLDSSAEQRAVLDQRFRRLAFRNPVPPYTTTSGFVLTRLDEGVKLVQLDLVASRRVRTFSMLTVVPGFRADYKVSKAFQTEIYTPAKITNYTDDAAFRAVLERLPCCVANKESTKNGDPLNLVIVGGLDDAFPALVRRGWHPTEEKWSGSVGRIVISALSGDRYPNAPVSDLYLFGRPQDLALQKARDNIHQRNHLRLWLSPIHYHGKQVWVGQISRDIGSRLTIHSPTLTTHKIDPNVDEARTALAEDMAYSQNLTKYGLVEGVGRAPQNVPRENLTTDPYYTDGYRAVLVFDREPTSMAEIDFFEWGTLPARNDAVRGAMP